LKENIVKNQPILDQSIFSFFDNLSQIQEIANDLKFIKKQLNSNIEKRWLSTKELSLYIPYSTETINKKVQDETFICGVHFYQHQKTRMFDKLKIDEWIINNQLNINKELKKQKILKKISLNI